MTHPRFAARGPMAAAGVLISAGLVLAGCSSGKKSTTPSTTTPSSTGSSSLAPVTASGGTPSSATAPASTVASSGAPAPASGTPIQVGLLADYTGTQSYLGPDMESGVRTAIAAINAAGGVMGRPFNLSTGDTVGDPVDAIPAYHKMISVNHVVAMIGPTSNEGPALLPISQQNKIPMFLQGGTTALDHETNPFYFRTTVGDATLGKAMAVYATSKHLTKAAFAFVSSTSAQTLISPIKTAFEGAGGKTVATVSLVPAASSYRSQIETLIAAKPDVVFFQQDPQTAGTFFHQATELGFDSKTTWVGTDTESSGDVFKALGPTIATTNFFTTYGGTEHDAALTAFTSLYLKQTGKSQFLTFAPESYDATTILALAMQEANSTDGAAVQQAILKVSSPSPGSVTVSTYAEGLAALKAGKAINYDGVASTDDFDQWHNVAGPMVVAKWTAAGVLETVASFSDAQLK